MTYISACKKKRKAWRGLSKLWPKSSDANTLGLFRDGLAKWGLLWNQYKPMSWYEVTDPTEPNPVKRNRTIRIIEAAWANKLSEHFLTEQKLIRT